MRKVSVVLKGLFFIIILASCQQIFTYSPVSWVQRDPADLPDDQKIAYAESVLSSGDTAAIAEAYDVINDLVDANPGDVDLQLLAADLALGGSGIIDTLENIDDITTLDEAEVEAILTGIDLTLVAASADHVVAAEAIDASAISPEQYLNTGLILLAKAADEAGGFANLDAANVGDSLKSGDPGWDTLVQADYFITQGGGDITDYGVSNANL